MKVMEYPFDGEYILKKKKSIKRDLLDRKEEFLEKKIAILGGSTTAYIKQVLELFLLKYDIMPRFYESEYNQYYEDIMFPNPQLEEFSPDIIYIHTTYRNIKKWPAMKDTEEEIARLLDEEYRRYVHLWEKARAVYHCIIIQNNFEFPSYRLLGNKDASDIHGKVNYITRLNLMFGDYAREQDDFYIQDINYLSASYGLDKWSDSFFWHMYKYSPAVPAIPELCHNLSRIIKSLYGKNKKVLVLDMDNTLWGGVIGEEGSENIEIGQENPVGQVYAEFQSYLKEQLSIGVLLSINSKNDYANAVSGLRRPDSILKECDFQVIKANWESKDLNMREIASELDLAPESMVFVDDNPAEREIVRNGVAGCAVPEFTRAERYIDVLDKSGFFETTTLSKDDLKRNEMYKLNNERQKSQDNYASYEDYLISLSMRATIKSFEPVYLSRITQLINKSNQFNLTTKRYTQAEIAEIAKSLEYIALYGKLEDKFGDNGVVSIIIGKIVDGVFHIDLWVMSCRVLKRNMEYAMMDCLIKRCQQRGVAEIRGYYYPTKKNGMVKDFYEKTGFTKVSENAEGNTVWSFVPDCTYKNKNYVIEVEEE